MSVVDDLKRRVREVTDKAVDDREAWLTSAEVASRAGMAESDVLAILEMLARESGSGVRPILNQALSPARAMVEECQKISWGRER